jgi:type II secretory pathway pseudopilin PulG
MKWVGAGRSRHSLVRISGDAGITLVEVVVAVSIMAVAMSIFTTGIVQIYRAENKTESASNAQSAVNLAFLRLDRELRYASDISSPGQYNLKNWRVEYLVTNSGTALCNQLQLDVDRNELQRRSWSQGTIDPTNPPAWARVAAGVRAPEAPDDVHPFVLNTSFAFKRLEVRLIATSGSGATKSTAKTDVTFTAMNSTVSGTSTTPSTDVCTEGRDVVDKFVATPSPGP